MRLSRRDELRRVVVQVSEILPGGKRAPGSVTVTVYETNIDEIVSVIRKALEAAETSG